MWTWLNDNGTALAIALTVIPIVWSSIRYLEQKKKELEQERFKTYHSLITQLVSGENGVTLLDRQVVCIYELRRFKEYYPVSYRTLNGLRTQWAQNPMNQRLIHEIDLAICYIRNRMPRAETYEKH